MGSALTIQRKCERCTRVEEIPVTIEDVRSSGFELEKTVNSLKIEIDGVEIGSFGHLCEICREITTRYVQQIFRKMDKVSALRERKSPKKVEEPIDTEVERGKLKKK